MDTCRHITTMQLTFSSESPTALSNFSIVSIEILRTSFRKQYRSPSSGFLLLKQCYYIMILYILIKQRQQSRVNATHFNDHLKTLAVQISITADTRYTLLVTISGVLISPKPDQDGHKLQRSKILMFIYPIYNRNWRNISTIYIYNKTSIKRNILTIKQNTSKVGRTEDLSPPWYVHFSFTRQCQSVLSVQP
jgi:hypothetical protein